MKKFLFGLALGIGLAFSLSAQAEEIKSLIGAQIEGQFPVTVNGEKIDDPGLVVGGKSYLPSRTIAEMFDAEISFDADLGIDLTTKVITPVKEATKVEPTESFNPSNPSEPEVSLEHKIRLIEIEIRDLGLFIAGYQFDIDHGSEEVKEKARQKISEYESRIAELEAEKAELEAQLETP